MDGSKVFKQWVNEDRCIERDFDDQAQVIFMDNPAHHKKLETTADILDQKHVSIRFFPPNGANVCQPMDASILQNFQLLWHRKWNEKKRQLSAQTNSVNTQNGSEGCSGTLQHLGKDYFLKLAAYCCREVNHMTDSDGTSAVRKSMIRCGLSLNTTRK